MKKLRPKNPLFLAVIEEAQVPSMAIIAGFCHDCLPTTDSAFESLSNSKSHRPSSYRSRANQLTTTQLYQVYRGWSVALLRITPHGYGDPRLPAILLAVS
jgi:hypothetical protein